MEKANLNKIISSHLLNWYKKNKRDLPWRKTKDPYAILVSEMMLQQTQVKTVIDYYHRFLVRFPDFETLAGAEEQEVLNAWQGLGYYSRARNLHALAKRVVTEYSGMLPNEEQTLKKLPGIGDYMCGAVMSIAFGQPLPAVDGNVLRVVSRVLNMHDDVTQTQTRKRMAVQVAGWIPSEAAGDFTQALMELGALICKPKSPECGTCPLQSECTALAAGEVEQLPVKTPKSKPVVIPYYALLITSGKKLMMEKRNDEGLLAGMWGVPLVEKSEGLDIEEFVRNWLGLSKINGIKLGDVVHTFTHRRWEMAVMHYQLTKSVEIAEKKWCSREEIAELPVPTAFNRVIRMLSFQKRKKDEEK